MTAGYPSMPSHSAHPSLDGYRHPHSLAHGLAPHPHPSITQGGQTCVPSLIPPGIDPAQVDIRTFYPYQPNEVKHRKRTTRPQLKVLEGVYEHDTKPNALLRKKLAEELGMTPRGVQVWFQNRRAKEKNQAKKLDANFSTGGSIESTASSSTLAAGSSSSTDAATTSDGEPSTASVSEGVNSENSNANAQSSSSPQAPSSSLPTIRRTSLPTVPAIPALDGASLADGSSGIASGDGTSSLSSSGLSQNAVHSVRGSNPTAAELLAQRRPSLPILNFQSSPKTLRRMPSNLPGRPNGFDPNARRKSVDTMNVNMQRLSTHPYARQAAQYTAASGHGHHGLSVYPHGLHPRRSISQSAGISGLDDGPDGLPAGSFPSFNGTQQTTGGQSYYLTPPQTHRQNQNRPMLSQRASVPSFHHGQHHQQQQQLASPPTANNGSFAGLSFTDPWGSPSQSHQTASSATDTPISPHALPPPSPGASAPPPISQSYSNSMLSQSLSRRYPMGHTRPIPAPVPGPLPDAHFSFGLPSSTSSSNGSPSSSSPVVHDNVLGMMGRGGAVLEEEDDASAVSSTYDPTSRFGSFASVASTESSWTSAHYSDVDGRKLSVSGPDGFDDQRRGSFASGYLPQLFGEMDVSGGNTPQPLGDSGAPVEQSHPDPARRGSSAGSLHEQQAFSGAYAVQEVYESGLQHDSFTSNDQPSYTHTPPQPEQYVADNGSYSPSSTISARSQSAANPEGVGKHSHSPPMPQHSSSSELMYALHPSNPTENLNNTELAYPTQYDHSLANPSENHISPHQTHAQYDTLSSKPDQYTTHSYAQQADTYEMPQQHMPAAYQTSSMEYPYPMYQDPSLYHNGAVEIGSVCVPAMMDGYAYE